MQSRIKELEKIERIEIPPDEKTIHFRFPQPKPSGRIVAEFRDVAKSYGAKHVFSGASFTIERGDRIALVGVNGAGKSTLIKLLSGEEPVRPANMCSDITSRRITSRRISTRRWIRMPRFSTTCAGCPAANNTELRSILGCFLFSEDDVFKQIGVLSGGERNRYALARMLMMPGNFLLLDEPTNHLDMRAKDVLLTALQEFNGTVVFVSHDRYFIDKLATRVFEVADGAVHVFPGNYEDYLWRKKAVRQRRQLRPSARRNRKAIPQAEPRAPKAAAPAPRPSPRADKDDKQRRLNPIKLRQMKERQRAIEDEITRLEVEIADFEQALSNFQSARDEHRNRGACLSRAEKT